MPDIEIRPEELNDPRIDEIINVEQSLTRSEGEDVEEIDTPLYLNPIFYYGGAASLMGFLMWCLIEPLFSDQDTILPIVANYVMFAPVASAIALGVGMTYGIANRNWSQAFHTAVVGLGVALGLTVITSFIAGFLFGLGSTAAIMIAFNGSPPQGQIVGGITGIGFVLLMCSRGIAWAIISMGAGMGLGIALKSKKLVLNGLAGGMVGGMLGGLVFDPVHRFICNWSPEAALSRAVGFTAIGTLVGVFIGFFENLSKDAWFQMLRGPLAGKQFILFKSPMVIGSAPKCDIYLFKDPDIEPKHAVVTRTGRKYLIADQNTPTGLTINDRAAGKHMLQNGDVVGIGDTVLRYHERQKSRAT